jgi:hypothetical protein
MYSGIVKWPDKQDKKDLVTAVRANPKCSVKSGIPLPL